MDGARKLDGVIIDQDTQVICSPVYGITNNNL